MLKEFIDTRSSIKMGDVSTNINERVNYTAVTGTALISTANTSRTGGVSTNVLATGSTSGSVGTLIKKLTIHGRGNTTRGTIRLWVGNGETFSVMIEEIDVAAVVQSSIANAFSVTFDLDWSFSSGLFISASTEKAEAFVVTLEGLDLKYP